MAQLIGQAFWLAIAVTVTGIAHMVVVKRDLFPLLNVPLDAGRTLGGGPIFGHNKTWRGVVVMVVGAALVGALQGLCFGRWAAEAGVECIDFRQLGRRMVPEGVVADLVGYAWVNAVLGLGYVIGELPNSFAKRRLSITPGATRFTLVGGFFFLLDQADSVIVALGLGHFAFGYGWPIFWLGAGCLTLLHLSINLALYLGKVRRNL